MGYPVLGAPDPVLYRLAIEHAMIAALAREGICARCNDSGLIVDGRVIASLATRAAQGLSQGSFVVHVDAAPPAGLAGPTTSIRAETGRSRRLGSFRGDLAAQVGHAFGLEARSVSPRDAATTRSLLVPLGSSQPTTEHRRHV